MANELMIKEVDFNGASLLAVQEQEGNKIFVGVNYVLRGLGFSGRQIEYQRNKWNEDKVVAKGVQKFSYPSEQGGMQETYCINIKKLPIALAKINITPKIEKDMPYLADTLEIYQENCADILAKAFLPNVESFIQDYLNMDDDEKGIAYFQERKERKLLELQAQELIPKARSFDQLIGANGSQNMNTVAKSFNVGRTRLFAFLREKDILMTGSKNDKEKHNVPRQQYLEQKLFVVREYTIPDADGEIVNRTQTLVTSKGIEFIDKLLKEIDYDLEKFSDLDDWLVLHIHK